MVANIRIVAIESAEQLAQAHSIRRAVFIEEQNVPEEIELDDEDAIALHALALDGDLAVGCGRMVAHSDNEHCDYVKISRMAVLKARRGEGIGERILAFLMAKARAGGKPRAVLHAQMTAEGFYLKNGFIPIGEVFEEAGIAHRKMERKL